MRIYCRGVEIVFSLRIYIVSPFFVRAVDGPQLAWEQSAIIPRAPRYRPLSSTTLHPFCTTRGAIYSCIFFCPSYSSTHTCMAFIASAIIVIISATRTINNATVILSEFNCVIFSVIIFRFKLTVTVYILLYRYHDMNIHVVL